MKNILYISFLNEDIRPGYKKKIHSQAKAFSELGYNSYLLIVNKTGFNLYSFRENSERIKRRIPSKKKRYKEERNVYDELFLFNQFVSVVKEVLSEINIDYVYIRRIVPITPKLLKLLSYIKSKKITVIYEYPTLPWEDEIRRAPNVSLISKFFYFLDSLFYKKLVSKVDIITYMGYYTGNEKKFIKIQNCGNPNDYKCKGKYSKNSNSITMIGVAHVSYIHGFDLLIDALKRYYDEGATQEVNFKIVGTVDSSLGLEEKVKQLNLGEHVFFCGYKVGEELDLLFEEADIGINVLNSFDLKASQKYGITTLKTVEYTFRGLPQVSSAPFAINGCNTDIPEFLYVEKSDKLDIHKIVDFYNHLTINSDQIRQYAINHMSWAKVLERIFLNG